MVYGAACLILLHVCSRYEAKSRSVHNFLFRFGLSWGGSLFGVHRRLEGFGFLLGQAVILTVVTGVLSLSFVSCISLCVLCLAVSDWSLRVSRSDHFRIPCGGSDVSMDVSSVRVSSFPP